MTEATDAGIDKLTPKQQAFVEVYLESGNAADAYRRVYACANMAAATVQREATRRESPISITWRRYPWLFLISSVRSRMGAINFTISSASCFFISPYRMRQPA